MPTPSKLPDQPLHLLLAITQTAFVQLNRAAAGQESYNFIPGRGV